MRSGRNKEPQVNLCFRLWTTLGRRNQCAAFVGTASFHTLVTLLPACIPGCAPLQRFHSRISQGAQDEQQCVNRREGATTGCGGPHAVLQEPLRRRSSARDCCTDQEFRIRTVTAHDVDLPCNANIHGPGLVRQVCMYHHYTHANRTLTTRGILGTYSFLRLHALGIPLRRTVL
jgi:hypothetical protein